MSCLPVDTYCNLILTIQTNLAFKVGDFVQVTHDIENYIIGQVLSYDPNTGVIEIDPIDYCGSGNFCDWTVNLAGKPGRNGMDSGTSGTSGTSGSSGTSGTSGSSGTSGVAGSSGTSGTSQPIEIGGTIGGGTTGSVLFINPTNTLAQDNSNFFWDDSANRLGIGTSSPSSDLTVSKNQNASTNIEISNTQSGTTSKVQSLYRSDTLAGTAIVGKNSNSFTTSGILVAADTFMVNNTKGDIALLNNFSSGTIKFAAGASSVAHVTIGTTGLVTMATGIQYKRLNPITTTTATTTSLTPDISVGDFFTITAQTGSLSVNNPTGTPVNGQKMMIRIKDNGTPASITWSPTAGGYRASSNLALPTATISTKTIYMGFIYNSTDNKWDLLALLNNF